MARKILKIAVALLLIALVWKVITEEEAPEESAE